MLHRRLERQLACSSASTQITETTSTDDNPRTGEPIGNGHRVRFVHRGYCQVDGSKLNQSACNAVQDSLLAFADTFDGSILSQMPRRAGLINDLGWRGNVVAYAEMDDGDVLDITMKDLRNIIDYLGWLPFQPFF